MNPPPPSSISSYPATNSESYNTSQNDYSSVAAAALSTSASNRDDVANARKRKAGSVPGSRGVANLTPEQLQKKRANDREAQRAIRERTKTTIESLEKRIQELESQQPYQELQRVAQERDRALEECAQLRQKLAMVQSVIGGPQTPQQPQPNLHELATLTAQQSPLPPLNAQYAQSGAEPSYQQVHPELRSPQHSTNSPITSHNRNVSYNSRLPPPAAMVERSGTNEERLDLNYVLGPKSHSPSTSPPIQGPQIYSLTAHSDMPIYARLPMHSPSTCPLDSLLLDFLHDRQKQTNDGIPMIEVAGPEFPSFTDLLNRPPTPNHEAHPLSLLMTGVVSTFPDISGLPEKVAVRYVMLLVLRWMICPCESCYESLPSWIRPIQEQLDIPHPIWNDSVPWPTIRRRLIMTSPVSLDDFFVTFTARMCVNWPYPDDQVLISTTTEPPSVKINPVFETHLRDLSNWSIASAFQATYPELVDETVRIEN